MTPRRKNMLEAFQDSTRAPTPEALAPQASKSPSLFSRGDASDPAAPLGEIPEPPARRRIEPVLAAAAGALLLVLSFFLGRLSVGDDSLEGDAVEGDAVRAAEASEASDAALSTAPSSGALELRVDAPADRDPGDRTSSGDATSGDATPTAAGETDARTFADRAFLDPTNVVTVAANRYGPHEQKRWTDDYYRLLDAGLPVVQPVREREGEYYVLCVGAEPRIDERVRDLLARVKAVPGFETAYVNNIDNLTTR